MPFLMAILFLVIGIAMLVFPDAFRTMNRVGNDLEGVKTEQGSLFTLNLRICGVLLIIGGIVLMVILTGI